MVDALLLFDFVGEECTPASMQRLVNSGINQVLSPVFIQHNPSLISYHSLYMYLSYCTIAEHACILCLHCNWTCTILEYNMYTCIHTHMQHLLHTGTAHGKTYHSLFMTVLTTAHAFYLIKHLKEPLILFSIYPIKCVPLYQSVHVFHQQV